MTHSLHSTRRGLVCGGVAGLAAGALALAAPDSAAAAGGRERVQLLATVGRVQIKLYDALLDRFPPPAFAAVGLDDDIREQLARILVAEETHVATLDVPVSGDEAAGSEIALPAELRAALAHARDLESLAVMAYAGVIPTMRNSHIVQRLTSIHSVEARHAAWLCGLTGADPFPDELDHAIAPDQIMPRLKAFLQIEELTGVPALTDDELAPALAAIAAGLGISPDAITVVSATRQDWSDSSLGCPEEGNVYLEVITPGFLIVVDVAGEQIEYHADALGNVVRCA